LNPRIDDLSAGPTSDSGETSRFIGLSFEKPKKAPEKYQEGAAADYPLRGGGG
jgi:hypothetical protein